jgi:hypothetical protein
VAAENVAAENVAAFSFTLTEEEARAEREPKER